MAETHRIHTPLEPLNIHYHDFEETELNNGPAEQRDARMTRNREAANRVATVKGKRDYRRKVIQRRQDFCKVFDEMSGSNAPRPGITQRNLDHSPFLSLPLELRQQVYDIYYSFLDSVTIQDLTFDGTFILTSYRTCTEQWPPGRADGRTIFKDLLGLPLVCRIIFTEAIPFLYKRVSIRFTDPEFAVSIPKTISLKMLDAVRSLEFSFSLHISLEKMTTSKRDILMASRYRIFKIEDWKLLWPALAALRGLRNLTLKIHEQSPSMAVSLPRVGESLRQLRVPIGLDHTILDPLLCFGKGEELKVQVELCWRPEYAILNSMQSCGIIVMVNGVVAEREEDEVLDIFNHED